MKYIKAFEGSNVSLFRSNEDRELWIKLNAERQISWEKNLTYWDDKEKKHKPTHQALNPRTMEEAMEISRNQCKHDEKEGKLRYSMEELLLKDIDELTDIGLERHKEWIKRFKSS